MTTERMRSAPTERNATESRHSNKSAFTPIGKRTKGVAYKFYFLKLRPLERRRGVASRDNAAPTERRRTQPSAPARAKGQNAQRRSSDVAGESDRNVRRLRARSPAGGARSSRRRQSTHRAVAISPREGNGADRRQSDGNSRRSVRRREPRSSAWHPLGLELGPFAWSSSSSTTSESVRQRLH